MAVDHSKRNYLREHAQGMVEFALVLPMLLMLSYGIIETGRILFIYSSVMISSRDAARYGSAAGDIGGNVTRYQDCDGIRAAAKRLGSFAGMQDADINITYDHGPGSGTNFASCPMAPGVEVNLGDRIIVQVSASYTPWLPLVDFPAFPINAVTRRTILKNVQVEGTPPSPVTPTVSFVSSSQNQKEGDGPITVALQLSAPTDKAVTVEYTIDGTAQNGVDYTISPNKVVFTPGDVLAEIIIDVIDDEMDEDTESVVLTLESPQHAIIGSPDVHLATIENDDPPPDISFLLPEQSLSEDIDGSAVLQLSAPSSRNITVNFNVTGTAENGGIDFSISSSPIVIPAGETSYPIIINVNDDTMDEEDETIVISLGEVINATKTSPDQNQVTLIDNDAPPLVFFTWESQDVDEESGRATVEVQLSGPSAKSISVSFNVSGTATEGSDYDLQDTSYSFLPGEVTQSIDVRILSNGDNDIGDETIILSLSTPVNATKTVPSTHTITIKDVVVIPAVFFESGSQTVDESATVITATVRLSSATSEDVSVPLNMGGTSTQGIDYTLAETFAVISAGGASTDIRINIIDDALDEYDETIVLTFGTPTNATIGSPASHTVRITDDDYEPDVYFESSGQNVSEAAGSLVITARLSIVSAKEVTLTYSSVGTAELGTDKDYTISSGPLVIPAGSTAADIFLEVNDDNVFENNEDIVISLSMAINATLGSPATYTLTIQDNEPVCPSAISAPVFSSISSKEKLLTWTLQSPNPLVVVNMTDVSVRWPSESKVDVTTITFGGPIYPGPAAPPPYLAVNNPQPLWSGAFNTQQMIFKFFGNYKSTPGEPYIVTSTFEGCPTISGIYSGN